ncbi:Uma2 family endonuclease [Terriglobus albidus]|uniref:Uma2 family endonuclease n=1 Tax=Terriglobus albidus TaxID=1592106 RepID=A0A5B9EA72_9BACT|nr:Uma2 family endonuclease [Terriglobus albidus]QEE27331.1 Uma2 family endonuclease [Terriglobus albidus]
MQLSLDKVAMPARLTPSKPMTDAELLEFCATNDFYQIEREPNGDLSIMTPSGGSTSHRNVYIARMLDEWAEKFGGVAFDSNAGFVLPDGSMRSPDAAWIEGERWWALSEREQEVFAPITPYFVIELRSPSDKLPELEAKMEMWLANGVQLAWLIDPLRKTVVIYRPGREPEEQEGHTSAFGEGLLASFELPLGRIWR